MNPAPATQSTLTIDASAMVALLIDGGAVGSWAVEQCRPARLIAPTLLPFEVANVLRRHSRTGVISPERARLAHRAMVDLRVEYWPYVRLAERIWQLSGQLTSYDAAYCALAEIATAPLLTLDEKLSRTTGPRCDFRVFTA